MSVSVTKADGVTVFTVTTDPQSACPPLCQVLKGLCYSPVGCSVSQHLRRVQGKSQSVLGALQIMVGLLNIGLGAILCVSGGGSGWEMDFTAFPFWMGGVFVLFGIVNILSEKYPSPCLVTINVILNVAGVAFAIAAIILYSINIANIYLWYMCNSDYEYYTPSPNPEDKVAMEDCLKGKALVLMLLRGMNAVLIVLSVLELCVVISSAVLGIKALRSSGRSESKSPGDPEGYRPLLEDATSNPSA